MIAITATIMAGSVIQGHNSVDDLLRSPSSLVVPLFLALAWASNPWQARIVLTSTHFRYRWWLCLPWGEIESATLGEITTRGRSVCIRVRPPAVERLRRSFWVRILQDITGGYGASGDVLVEMTSLDIDPYTLTDLVNRMAKRSAPRTGTDN